MQIMLDSCIASRNIATGTVVNQRFKKMSTTNPQKENSVHPKKHSPLIVAFYFCSIGVSPKTHKLTTRISCHESQSKSSSDFVAEGGGKSPMTLWFPVGYFAKKSSGTLKMRVSNRNLHFQVDTVHILRCYVSFWGVYGLEGVGFSSNLRETWVILWKMSCFWLLENLKQLFFQRFLLGRDFFFQPAERPT